LVNIWKKVIKSEFTKNVTVQVLGTGIAQALPFLATPLLTRLFNEEDFAVYTSFFAIVSIFAVAVGGKYHLAILLPEEEEEANKVFILSIYLTLAYALAIALLFPLFHHFFPENLNMVLNYVPVYVLFFGLWSSYINVSIRHKRFVANAVSKVLQAISYILVAIVLGFSKILTYGLVLAKILGTVSSWIFLSKKSTIKFKFNNFKRLKNVALKYIDYPKYGIWPAFLNTLSLQALILILTKFYSTENLGYYGLTYLVLSAPISLIGTSFKDVFYQRMVVLTNQKDQSGQALLFFRKSALALFIMGIPICLILFLFGEPLFAFIFGNKWGRSGEFAGILAFSFLVKLTVSPLSSVFNATNTLRIASKWQVLYFISTFAILGYCASILKLPIEQLLEVYVIQEIILYGIYFVMQHNTIRTYRKYT